MDLSQFAVDSLVVVAVFVCVNLVVKPLIEVWIGQTNVAHDPVIRGLAVLLGVVGVFVDHGFPGPGSGGSAWIGLVLSGILSGLSAIGLFHVASTGNLLTGSASPSSDAATPPIDYAALAAALEPALARLAPGLVVSAPPAPERIVVPASATIPPAGPPPQSPPPGPAADAAPPAQP